MFRKTLSVIPQGGKKLFSNNNNNIRLVSQLSTSSSFHTASQKLNSTKPATPVASPQGGDKKSNDNNNGGQKQGSMAGTVVLSTLLTGALGVGFVLYFNNYLQSLQKKHEQQSSSIENYK